MLKKNLLMCVARDIGVIMQNHANHPINNLLIFHALLDLEADGH